CMLPPPRRGQMARLVAHLDAPARAPPRLGRRGRERGRRAPQVRRLVVNADDFGYSPGINAGVLEAHRRGIVTSASLMVPRRAARELKTFGVGLHADFGEWRYENGGWVPLYAVVPLDSSELVERELRTQLARFRALVGREPTHLDSHQHVHAEEPAASVFAHL